MAPVYLAELCRPVSSIDGHRHLRFARRGQLDVPRVRLSTYGGRAFCHAGPSAWNALPVCLKNNTLSLSNFSTSSNISTSCPIRAHLARSRFLTDNALCKFPIYLLYLVKSSFICNTAVYSVVNYHGHERSQVELISTLNPTGVMH